MISRRRLVPILAASVLALAGCSSDDSGGSTTSSAGEPITVSGQAPSGTGGTGGSGTAAQGEGPPADADLATTEMPVSMEDALDLADKENPDETVTKIELEHDAKYGVWVWKIDSQQGTNQHELKLNAVTGDVLSNETDQESDDPQAVDPTKLTPQNAMARAIEAVPGTVAEWSLEYDDGVQQYDIDIRTGSGTDTTSVEIDVDTLAVTVDD